MDAASRSAAALGIDFGTHNTVAAVLRGDGRRHQILFDGHPLLPSGIYIDHDGSLLVGRDAAREARRHPHRYERNPKLRLDAPSLLLGDREVPIGDAVRAVLRRVLAECTAIAGPPRSVTVTVPAAWGPNRRHIVTDAALAAGLPAPLLLPEPVAAARYFAEVLGHRIEPGRALVVYDLGAGTFDASAVAFGPGGFEVLAVDGSDRVGGHYLDQALVDYLGGRFAGTEERSSAWRALLDPDAGGEVLRARFQLYDEVREAKERLSRRSTTEVLVPGFAAEELLTRAELDLLARPLLAQTVAITKAVIREARLSPDQVAGVFMVGGASRMPLAATMIHQELGIAPTMIEQPELVVGEGAVAVADQPVTPAAVPPPALPLTPAAVPPPTAPVTVVQPVVQPPPPPRRRGLPVALLAIATVLAASLVGGGAWWLGSLDGQAAEEDPTGTEESETVETEDPASPLATNTPEPEETTTSAAPEVITGEVYWNCPQTRLYCAGQGGEPGIRGSASDPTAIGYAAVGTVFELVCYETADLITPRGNEGEEGYWDYHEGKDASDVMVRVVLGENEFGYIPFVWLIIDPADVNSLGGLAEC
ncbi:Hsp70 family protein [Glycomyces artemisiae]|uniref:Hsp70 protein n=1 Tax=Glycomyces artemisiae TaxID=1076443 RepID=A0A2T0UKE5_9ACTN|nr:Hsp70 family protein [Glycomyces artemisiae]PRY58419.1 Hsp70 protein [Glycomyces artemisiae]